MRVIHRWSVSMPSPDQVYATAPVAFRLLSGPGQATNEVEFAIERCDCDRAGGDRWCDVSTWSQTMALKSNVEPSYFCLAVLAAAVTQLAKTDPPRPYPYREGNSWLDW
jgi:hypothetical protein